MALRKSNDYAFAPQGQCATVPPGGSAVGHNGEIHCVARERADQPGMRAVDCVDELSERNRMEPRPGMPESFRDYLRQRWEGAQQFELEQDFQGASEVAKVVVYRKTLFRDRNQTIMRTLFTLEPRPDALRGVSSRSIGANSR
jgi:hypothetical protein